MALPPHSCPSATMARSISFSFSICSTSTGPLFLQGFCIFHIFFFLFSFCFLSLCLLDEHLLSAGPCFGGWFIFHFSFSRQVLGPLFWGPVHLFFFFLLLGPQFWGWFIFLSFFSSTSAGPHFGGQFIFPSFPQPFCFFVFFLFPLMTTL